MPTTRTNLIVFAKAPVPGEVKTRLAPALDGETAALLHAALVERALAIAREGGFTHLGLCCAPDTSHAFFQSCAEDFDVVLTPQGPGDLGERMLRALRDGLDRQAATIIIGADCPALTGAHLAAAARSLATRDVVLTPAEDGGYVLIGARRLDDAMFAGIDWGTHTVLDQQRRQLQVCGMSWHEMETLWDVDRPEDLPRVKALNPPLAFFWPS